MFQLVKDLGVLHLFFWLFFDYHKVLSVRVFCAGFQINLTIWAIVLMSSGLAVKVISLPLLTVIAMYFGSTYGHVLRDTYLSELSVVFKGKALLCNVALLLSMG